MPEFPGYTGPACAQLPIIKVKAVTHRLNPIMQTCIGPSEEHVNLAGIPTEASILQMVEKAMPGRLLNVYAHTSGGGKYMAVLQFKKSQPSDEGRQRQAALLAFSAFSELKHVILVDEDVDPFDSNDVLWALNTRYQGDVDTVFIPGVRCHPLDLMFLFIFFISFAVLSNSLKADSPVKNVKLPFELWFNLSRELSTLSLNALIMPTPSSN